MLPQRVCGVCAPKSILGTIATAHPTSCGTSQPQRLAEGGNPPSRGRLGHGAAISTAEIHMENPEAGREMLCLKEDGFALGMRMAVGNRPSCELLRE